MKDRLKSFLLTLCLMPVLFFLSPSWGKENPASNKKESLSKQEKKGKSTSKKQSSEKDEKNILKRKSPKNILYFIGDGMGPSQITLTRLVFGPLYMDGFQNIGKSKTYCSNNSVTDSAAAGTALACGFKTERGVIGMVRKQGKWKKVVNIAEYLRDKKGYAIGILTTTRITHATPASFYAHVWNRNQEAEISRQILSSHAQVLMGGGRKYFMKRKFALEDGGLTFSDLLKKEKEKKILQLFKSHGLSFSPKGLISHISGRSYLLKEEKNWYFIHKKGDGFLVYTAFSNLRGMIQKGYKVALDKKDLQSLGGTEKILGLFASSHMSYEVDRDSGEEGEPSILEMTRKALEVLSKTGKPFFLMVEGGRIDHAAHSHDGPTIAVDTFAFDRAIGFGKAWAAKDQQTLMVITADHATGALGISKNFQPDLVRKALKKGWISSEVLARRVLYDKENVVDLLKQTASIHDLTARELRFLHPGRFRGASFALSKAIGHVRSERLGIYFYPLEYYGPKRPEHSGEDVPVYAFGPGSEFFRGTYENTSIPVKIMQALGITYVPR